VTEPDLRSAADANTFLHQLRQTLLFLGVSDVNMDEGSLRCDANVSVRKVGATELGTKTELKNMNSFRFLERGVDAEIARQIAILEGGGRVAQETLHYDPATGGLHSLRSKEESHDYRYFPEPDLVAVDPDPMWIEELRRDLPELPGAIRRRWVTDHALSFEDAEVLSQEPKLVAYVDAAAALTDPKLAANWIRGELRAQLRELGQEPWESRVTPALLAELVDLVASRTVSQAVAKEVLAEVIEGGGSPSAIVEAKGLGQIADAGELEALVDRLLGANPAQAQQLRDGKEKLIGFFVGQAMKETQGRADAAALTAIINERTK
jgi:aspartyl-tRNA(Asn)/glutamyl-tRNA(Gln) amidotransferase subunit B